MDVELISSSESLLFPHLKIIFRNEYKNRNLSLLIWIDYQKDWSQNSINQQKPTLFLQFLLIFPFNYIESALDSTARYILLINKTIAYNGFGLSEVEKGIYFKYVLSFPESKLEENLIKGFIGLIRFLYDTYAPNLESIASGSISYQEMVSL